MNSKQKSSILNYLSPVHPTGIDRVPSGSQLILSNLIR